MTHARPSLFASLLLATCASLNACDLGERDENYRPYPRPDSGSSGVGGHSGSGMDSSVDSDSGDDDSGLVAGTGGSGGMDASVTTPPFTAAGLLAASGRCAMDTYAEFETAMTLLVAATTALANDPTSQNLRAAQDAYRVAAQTWQRAELFRFGPAARAPAPGADDLRDLIYGFPFNNACGVDRQIVDQKYAQPSFATSLVGMRGLFALEYLLFNNASNNACDVSAAINTNGTWAALSNTELTQRRADYAHAAATDVLMRARTLVQAWEPSGGNFIAQWNAPGAGRVYTTEHDALVALVTAIFYLDKEVKDLKLAVPLSIPLSGVTDCIRAPNTCPELLESRFARISADNIRQNLIAFRQVFQGCGTANSGLGIDDWLRSIDQGDLADRMLSALDNADTTVNGVGSLEDATVELPPTAARDLHAAIKAITDLLKTELVMVLNVQLPGPMDGDVD